MSASAPPDEIHLVAIEGGGSKFIVSIARIVSSPAIDSTHTFSLGPTTLELLHTQTFPGHSPSEILPPLQQFLHTHLPRGTQRYSALGIATFGPAGVDPHNSNYGTILPGCPKREWRGVPLMQLLRRACSQQQEDLLPVAFDTDVNAPAWAEFRHGQQSQQGNNSLTNLAYVTLGTGVGVGLVINSQRVHGLLHPEGGHLVVQPLEGDDFPGYSWGREKSPYKGVGTVEGIASSVALTERLIHMGDSGNLTPQVLAELSDSHPLWSHAANAIANLCVSILLLTSCQKIVLGGGIMNRGILFPKVRQRVCELLNGYLDSVEELSGEEQLKEVIVESSWKEMGSGLVGAFALALEALEKSTDISKLKEKQQCETREEKERQGFASGMLAGIGLSLGCVVLSTLLGGGRSIFRRH